MEGFTGNSDLMGAVKLLEENGFYVVFADAGHGGRNENPLPSYPGALVIQAYPKRLVSVQLRRDPVTPA
jgi:hypothetical protein